MGALDIWGWIIPHRGGQFCARLMVSSVPDRYLPDGCGVTPPPKISPVVAACPLGTLRNTERKQT